MEDWFEYKAVLGCEPDWWANKTVRLRLIAVTLPPFPTLVSGSAANVVHTAILEEAPKSYLRVEPKHPSLVGPGCKASPRLESTTLVFPNFYCLKKESSAFNLNHVFFWSLRPYSLVFEPTTFVFSG